MNGRLSRLPCDPQGTENLWATSFPSAFVPFLGAQPDSLLYTIACLGQPPHVRSGSDLDNPGDGVLTWEAGRSPMSRR